MRRHVLALALTLLSPVFLSPGPASAEPTLSALAASLPAPGGQVRAAVIFGRSLDGVGSSSSLKATASLLPDRPGPVDTVDAFTVETELTADDLDSRRQLQVYGDLVAPPGRYRLRLEMLVGEESASADYPLELEAPATEGPSLLPPLLADDEEFVAAFYEHEENGRRRNDEPVDVRQPPSDYPFRAAGEPLVPDISPRLDEDRPRSRVCLTGRQLTDEETFLETSLIAADGTQLSKERLAVVSSDEANRFGFETLCLGLDSQGLEAGLYQLNVTLHDFEGRDTQRMEMPIEIVVGASLE